jgi:probable phosphoglycerate mutase
MPDRRASANHLAPAAFVCHDRREMSEPPSEREIWLVRHGATAWSASGQHTGRTDLELNEDGRRAASALPAKLSSHRFALVLTSPLSRAAETCRLAGYGDVAKPCDDLMEWDYGRYEGVTRADIRKQRPGWTIWRDGVVGGETIEQVASRATRALRVAESADGDALLFAHSHLLRVLTACWLELEPAAGRYFELGPAGVSVLTRSDNTAIIRRWNL